MNSRICVVTTSRAATRPLRLMPPVVRSEMAMLRYCLLLAVVMIAFLGSASAQEKPLEVKAKILRDVEDKEKALKIESDKLEALYKENGTLNPHARLDEVTEKAAKFSADMAKSAIKQVSSSPLKSVIDALSIFKKIVAPYKAIADGQNKALDELDRQQTLANEIIRQEEKVRNATIVLEGSKAAAVFLVPMLDAMEAARIEAIQQERIKNHAAGALAARYYDHLPSLRDLPHPRMQERSLDPRVPVAAPSSSQPSTPTHPVQSAPPPVAPQSPPPPVPPQSSPTPPPQQGPSIPGRT
jgi:hypothetical protein